MYVCIGIYIKKVIERLISHKNKNPKQIYILYILKKINKIKMNNIEESFQRAFRERKTQKQDTVEDHSDEDSAKEQTKMEEEKRQKKRRRTTSRSKNTKAKRVASEFKVRHAIKKKAVTTSEFPEILSVEEEFNMKNSAKELIIAETNFFNTKNQDSWQKADGGHVKPFDFPFVRALIQREPSETFDIHQFNDRERLRADIQKVTREYENEYLREPVGNERPCLLGQQCEGLQITMARDKAFILREFLLPKEEKEYQATGKFKPERRLCLMCKRKETARAWANIKADGMGMREDSVLQDWCNIVDIEGEYSLKDCVVSSRHTWEGLTDPIVLHIRSAYRLVEKNGIRYYDQWRMSYPKSTQHFLFQTPSH